MAPLKILICGGGICGPALAFWLGRNGHDVTIVERFPSLRASGAQIDLREQGIEVIKRMGLQPTIRGVTVDEAGMALIDQGGKIKAAFMANKSGKGTQLMTSDYELMRGDLVRVLYDATKDTTKYVFGKSVESFDDKADGVTVHFSDGTTDTYDILVGADGQGSRIRKAILPPSAPDQIRHLGFYMAYWFVPREEGDDNMARTCVVPGGRWIMRRTHNEKHSQVYFTLRDKSEELRSMPRSSVEKQKEFWKQKFGDTTFQKERFFKGMDTSENFYCQEVVQVKTDRWSKGRVVLLGDAAHCPSPFSGMGTTTALVGTYVLAGEILENPDNLDLAFANYEKVARPWIEQIQDSVDPRMLRYGLPDTQLAIYVIWLIAGILSFLRIPELIARFSNENRGGWEVPRYEALEKTDKTVKLDGDVSKFSVNVKASD